LARKYNISSLTAQDPTIATPRNRKERKPASGNRGPNWSRDLQKAYKNKNDIEINSQPYRILHPATTLNISINETEIKRRKITSVEALNAVQTPSV